jgi:ribokinase
MFKFGKNKKNDQQLDFLAIGDVVIDDFIELKDVRIDTDPDEGDGGGKEICFRFGEKIEFKSSIVVPAVGNSSNAAVSAHRLGLNAASYSNVGDDKRGIEVLDAIKAEGMTTDYINVQKGKATNYHYVLRFGPERTILVKHEDFDYAIPNFPTPPRYIYFSSIGENAVDFHREVANYCNQHDTKLVFQPGTFQIKLGLDQLGYMYQAADLFFCNKEEAQAILHSNTDEIPELLKEMKEKTGDGIVCITDGAAGAYAYDGEAGWFMPMYPDPADPVDRTGAGDSFSSTFTAALALGHDLPTALAWGPTNSMSVVQGVGAQAGLLTREKLQVFLDNAPADYKPKQVI